MEKSVKYEKVKNRLLPLVQKGAIGSDDKKMFKQHLRYLGKQNIKIVEIGSWLGCGSTLFLAKRLTSNSKIYAVAPWRQDLHETLPGGFSNNTKVNLYKQFLSNMIHLNIANKVVPLKGFSKDVAQNWPKNKKIDLLWIDGAHDEKSVIEDIKSWFPYLKKGGIICGDDYHLKLNFLQKGLKKIILFLNLSSANIYKLFRFQGNDVVKAINKIKKYDIISNRVKIHGCHWWAIKK